MTNEERQDQEVSIEATANGNGNDNGTDLDVSWYPTSIDELHELLTFYRKQAISFKNEKDEYENVLESLQMTSEEKHKLEWALHEKMQSNESLKKQLSDTHILLYTEKNSNIQCNAEIKCLKAKLNELTQNNQHLLSLLQSANENMNEMISTQHEHKRKSKRCSACHHAQLLQQSMAADHVPQKLTTIYLPNENTQTLQAQLEAKQEELENLKQESMRINEYLIKDRNKAYESLDAFRSEYDEKFKSLQTEISDLSQQHLFHLKEYLNYRRKSKQEIHELKVTAFKLQYENDRLARKYSHKSKHVAVSKKKMEKEVKKESSRIIHGFRMETMKKHEELNNVKDELNTLTKSYQFDVANLRQKLSATRKRNKRLNEINKCQKMGIQTDVENVKQRLKKLQKTLDQLELEEGSKNSMQLALQHEINKIQSKLFELAEMSER
eukprot:CAMPEP_0197025942 /NCGR_PEP_ID=MMETSP1384-20130603/6129_1 /TAXON_ID=29189 /ORGANISM="Ammonia sp." /LENGTH=438 /DNA_ID=CAMNT_0042454533 /DNA_START=48 /DNA_END=1364 /DNA_ORIENTATION=-